LEVLVGTAGAVTYTFVNNADSAVTTSFAAGPANFVFALAVGTTWARQTFSFVAPGTTTRIGFYNAYRNGDTVHAVNLDDVDLHAAVSTWNNAAGGSWTTPGNWLGAVTADGADATAHFGALDLTADATVTLDGARTIGNLIFGDRTPTHNWMLSAGSAGPLTLDVSSGACTLTVSNQTATVGLALAGSDPVVKAGAGTLVLGGANAYTGTTTVNAGTLLVNGAHTAGAAYSVATGVLGGSDGTIGSAVTVGGAGTLTGGDATTPGTLKITGDVSFVPGGQLLVNIQSGGYDQIDMNNAGAFAPANGALTLVVSPVSYAPAPGTELVVVRNIGGALSGMFSNATEGTEIRAGAGSYVVHYDSSGHRIYLTSRKIDNGSLFLVH
jgi:autotransporter-associated beta strand protein